MLPLSWASLLTGLSGSPYQQSEPFGYGGAYAPQFGTPYQSDPYYTAPYTPPQPEQRSMLDSILGRLPQPYDVFGGEQVAPVYRPGWSEFLQRLPGLFMPQYQFPTHEDFDRNPDYWPPGRIPYGERF